MDYASTSTNERQSQNERNDGRSVVIDLTNEASNDTDYLSDLVASEEEYYDLGDPVCRCEFCNALFWYDERKGKSCDTENPTYSLCCRSDKVKLPKINHPPTLLHNFLHGKDAKSKHFQDHIRSYNSMFAFTSMGEKIDLSLNTGNSPPTFRLHGQNYHLMGSLIPSEGATPKFAQLDKNNLHAEIVSDLKIMLDENNVLVKTFRMAKEKIIDQGQSDVKIKLIGRRHGDARTYNLPTVSEVAALVVGDFDESMGDRDLIVETQTGELKRINELHAEYLGLQYPLLFPYGEDGFREDIPLNVPGSSSGNNACSIVTMKDYFAFRLHERESDATTILTSKRLFQQFVVDAYTMIESSRLMYIRMNQKKMRADLYKGLTDALIRGETNPATRGKRVILPSSFVGGARYMVQNYQDVMAICKWAGYPNLFITFTCNPKWPEIVRYVEKRGLKPEDRPDIVCRVFKMKLNNLINDLRKEKIFGIVRAVVYTIEFQKRGLPHTHILLFLWNEDRNPSPDNINEIISAEIPDMDLDLKYYTAVHDFMLHGPCGVANKNSPCMANGRCTKYFPKKYVETTSVDEDGYPVYRRRNNGRTILKNGVPLDNRYVVPHNRYLLMKYGAHINVEWCNQSRSIKYLFKYINKGNNRVTACFYKSTDDGHMEKNVDEVNMYYDCRYISPCEAAWRIFGFKIQYKDPPVERLSFHLPNEQNIIFSESDTLDEVLSKPTIGQTKFLKWFEASGPTCYADIRTVNGIVYGSFKEACYAMGLLNDDREYIDGIVEASCWASAKSLRMLFVTLLSSDSFGSIADVWNACWIYLSDDILYNQRTMLHHPELQLTEDQIKCYTLVEIEKLLSSFGRTLREFEGIPYPSSEFFETDQNKLISDELRYDRKALTNEHKALISKLTDEQRCVYDTVINATRSNYGGMFFIYGYGGTGKTFIWNTLLAALRSKGEIVLNVASSGIASLLLPGGRTGHSRFKIPINVNEDSMCNINQSSPLAELIVKCKLIIWDEAPMMHKFCFEALDRSLRDIMRFVNPSSASTPFGGKTVVFGGDFRQILPVIPKGSRQDIVFATINSSYLWRYCKVLRLTKNMRLKNMGSSAEAVELEEFSKWIASIGDGTIGSANDGNVNIDIRTNFLIKWSGNPIDERRLYRSSDSTSRSDSITDLVQQVHTPEFLNSIKCSGVPNHEIYLKVGTPVMLLRNIDHANELCNGTRLKITRLGQHVLEAQILTGDNANTKILIPRMSLTPADPRLPFKFERRQFPLIVSYAMTINKSQEQSFSHVGLFLPRSVFTHGQLYVAVSRVRSRAGLKILLSEDGRNDDTTTTNVVYREVCQNV
ncbi:uncharacterized protein LOC131025941 [Salvia miltiorrhiza]|uniref:uncharacterized protein LOC131025941 n=1 Tax=Salvia miltiorrhiza TaxID=226208 RepID=UPI0025AD1E6A|nr:uncharacterized protein LOC131025941 [Salvia miltiorrhiza]